MGADDFIATGEEGWQEKHAGYLDLIIGTISNPKMPFKPYGELFPLTSGGLSANLCAVGPLGYKGRFVQLGLAEDPMPSFGAASPIMKGVSVSGSLIGSPQEIEEMLQLASDNKVQAWIQTRPMRRTPTRLSGTLRRASQGTGTVWSTKTAARSGSNHS